VVHVLVSGKNINIGCAADLSGDRAHIKAYTGYLVTGDDELDMNYVVRHHGKETECEMLAKGALRDNAKKTYRATIDFIKGCAGAKGQENEEVLLLSDDVVNKTIPNILCAEEEVEGEHGASIGQLSDDILYYMQSRGIPEDTAYEMMARSGVSAAAGRIPTRFTETAD
jgi:Fe-S cluster assembly scaffold protein SufB